MQGQKLLYYFILVSVFLCVHARVCLCVHALWCYLLWKIRNKLCELATASFKHYNLWLFFFTDPQMCLWERCCILWRTQNQILCFIVNCLFLFHGLFFLPVTVLIWCKWLCCYCLPTYLCVFCFLLIVFTEWATQYHKCELRGYIP